MVSPLRPSISMCVVRVVVSRRGWNRSTACTSAGGRSEFLANSVLPGAVAGDRATRQSHIAEDATAVPFANDATHRLDRSAHALGPRVVFALPDLPVAARR